MVKYGMSKTLTKADQELQKRIRADLQAHHELRLEGFERDPATEHLHRARVEGRISGEEFRAALLAHYGIKPKP